LKYGGVPAEAGQFGLWTPIEAEATGSGYEVAWRVPGSDQYSIWDNRRQRQQYYQYGGNIGKQQYADLAGEQLPSGI